MKEENDIVNLDKFKKTRSVTQAERAQRIMEWKVDTQIEFIKEGKMHDGADCLKATIEQSRNIIEKNRAKKKAVEVIDEIERRGYKDEAEQLRWILQKYLN